MYNRLINLCVPVAGADNHRQCDLNEALRDAMKSIHCKYPYMMEDSDVDSSILD